VGNGISNKGGWFFKLDYVIFAHGECIHCFFGRLIAAKPSTGGYTNYFPKLNFLS